MAAAADCSPEPDLQVRARPDPGQGSGLPFDIIMADLARTANVHAWTPATSAHLPGLTRNPDTPASAIACVGKWKLAGLQRTLRTFFSGSADGLDSDVLLVEDVTGLGQTADVDSTSKHVVVLCTKQAAAMTAVDKTAYSAASMVWCMELSQWLHLRRAFGIPESKLGIVPWLFLL
jgi:hypothetical protein